MKISYPTCNYVLLLFFGVVGKGKVSTLEVLRKEKINPQRMSLKYIKIFKESIE